MYKILNHRTKSSCFIQCNRLSLTVSRAEEVKKILGTILDPVLKQPLLQTGVIRDIQMKADGLMVTLDPIVPGHPYLNQMKNECDYALRHLDWVRDCIIRVNPITAPIPSTSSSSKDAPSQDAVSALAGIHNIIAVSSCKGGVGKSTVAVNLAFTLAKRGLRVGLLDADIYGPSLPYMVTPLSDVVRRSRANPKHILPLEAEYGLKMLSFGHVNPKAGVQGAGAREAAVLRGPVASKVITQMVVGTEWGDLDYLLVDMPPGTGDIQITLSQCLNFTGAVIVTTPHHLSLVDAAKGVAMFQHMNIPTLAMVENMSYFKCRRGEKYFPFGQGGRDNLLRGLHMSALGVTSPSSATGTDTDTVKPAVDAVVNKAMQRLQECPLHALPLSQTISSTYYNTNSPSSSNTTFEGRWEADSIYNALADDVILEIYKLKMSQQMVPMISYSEGSDEIILRDIFVDRAIEHRISAVELRIRDPTTGDINADPNKADKSRYVGVNPVKFDPKGNYGVAINWSDGHYADIFPYEVIRSIAKSVTNKSK